MIQSCFPLKAKTFCDGSFHNRTEYFQAELLRTVKRFERLKTDLISTLRSKEWRLDSESKVRSLPATPPLTPINKAEINNMPSTKSKKNLLVFIKFRTSCHKKVRFITLIPPNPIVRG